MQILRHGNKNKGYSIIESTVAILIASILLIVILQLTLTFTKSSTQISNYAKTQIEEQNNKTHEAIQK